MEKLKFKGTPERRHVSETGEVVDSNSESIADVWPPVEGDESANARLIAAAPELLAALENFRMIVECNPDLLESNTFRVAYDYANSVIKKSTGGIIMFNTPKVEEIDWEQRRYEIAKEVLPVFAELSETHSAAMARAAVYYADALVAELKKGGEE